MTNQAAQEEAHQAIERLCQQPSLLPVRPMVIDSDVWVRHVVRDAREGKPPNKLLIHAQMGTIRLYVAAQQIHEVRRHVAEVAIRSDVDPDLATKIFETRHLPLLWQIEVDRTRSNVLAAWPMVEADLK